MPFLCMGMVDVPARSMLRHGRFFGVVNVSARPIFSAANVSARPMFRYGRCFTVVDTLARLMLRHG